nr:hypothetical protein [Gracilaria pacifica]
MINKITEAQATGKYLRLSPHKTRRILNQIQGKNYQEAILILEFMPYKPCKVIKKILESAGNNALNFQYEKQNLIIKQAFANEGPKLKRFQPRAQGRAFKIQKPTCHITIKLALT